jgi:predicted  nucleic acid-binding Zn-ribbon protein
MNDILKEELKGTIYDISRVFCGQPDLRQLEKLDTVAERLATTIEKYSKTGAVDLIRELQKAMGESFTKIADDIHQIETLVTGLSSDITDAHENATEYREDLESRLEGFSDQIEQARDDVSGFHRVLEEMIRREQDNPVSRR